MFACGYLIFSAPFVAKVSVGYSQGISRTLIVWSPLPRGEHCFALSGLSSLDWAHLENSGYSPHFKVSWLANLILSASEFPLPCNLTFSHVLEVRMWKSLGGWALFCLPHKFAKMHVFLFKKPLPIHYDSSATIPIILPLHRSIPIPYQLALSFSS